MMNCFRCGHNIPENDLATRKAYQSKDGRTFCASCTAFLIARQKEAQAKAQGGQAPSAPTPPRQVKPVQKQPSSQTAIRTQRPAQISNAGKSADKAPAVPERKTKSPPISRAKYKSAAVSEPPEEVAGLKKSRSKKNLMITLGLVAAIIGLVGIFISIQAAKAKEEKQTKTLDSLRAKTKDACAKTDRASEASDPKVMDDNLELAKKAVQSFENYTKEIGQYDKNAKTIETRLDDIKKLEKKISERKSRIAQEESLQKKFEEAEGKITNPDTVESVYQNIEEMKQKAKELGLGNDFFGKLEKLEQKGQDLLVVKLLDSAKKFRETQPTDFDTARNKFIEALKKQKELELFLRQENEIAESKLNQAKEAEMKTQFETEIKSLGERIEKVTESIEDTINQLKEAGQAKYAAENQQETEHNMLDPKYSKWWKKSGEFNIATNPDNSITVTVPKKKPEEASIYYFGDDYLWEDVIIDIEFTIVEGNGLAILGRYYNEVYKRGNIPTFGMPWGFNFDIHPEDAGSSAKYARTLEAVEDRLKITGEGLNPDDQINNRNIKDQRFSKMGGVGIDFKSGSNVIIHKLMIKVVK